MQFGPPAKFVWVFIASDRMTASYTNTTILLE